ncbi:unnamed protein product [Caenorhabditis bovis]|uniref:JmjC domain-containing protein n=1 Tax=Caenorhabditis bovis TaxID=2654633 RepID=A0A8S1FDB9_9PELO|nr:unnamed protein product [Caenorhabditis bovis]
MSFNTNQVQIVKAIVNGGMDMQDRMVKKIFENVDVEKCLNASLKTDNFIVRNISETPAMTDAEFCKALHDITPLGRRLINEEGDSKAMSDFPLKFNLLAPLKVKEDKVNGALIVDMAAKRCQTKRQNEVFVENASPPDPPRVPKEKPDAAPLSLFLPTPLLICKDASDANSTQLRQICQLSDIVVVRGLVDSLGIDMAKFSTKALCEKGKTDILESRLQKRMPSHFNFNDNGKITWTYESIQDEKGYTLEEYFNYQEKMLRKAIEEEYERHCGSGSQHAQNSAGRGGEVKRMKLNDDNDKNSERNEIEEIPEAHEGDENDHNEKKAFIIAADEIVFGTNFDLSDSSKWGEQCDELMKLPALFRHKSEENFLAFLRHHILGMNRVQMYIKIPGSRTPAHQENNNMASVNLNVGPGDCEWFAVPYKYWGPIMRLCTKNRINFREGAYWPCLEDLQNARIPIYRFTQKAGDLVFLNGGCIHWVQATGWCNNVSWNIGPMNIFQLRTSLISYEFNKTVNFQSLVPMQALAWELADKFEFSNHQLFVEVRSILIKSLAFAKMTRDYAVSHNIKIKKDDRPSDCFSVWCTYCNQESFNFSFIPKASKETSTEACVFCAKSKGIEKFVLYEQLRINDLKGKFDGIKFTSN